MGRVGVAAELDRLLGRKLQNVLEALSDALETLAALGRVGSLVLATLGRLSSGSSPEANTPESLADVHDHSHDLVVVLVLQHLADRGKHDVEPSVVLSLAALEGVGPATAVLVLRVLPLWSYAVLEEMVVRLLGELGGRSDVVLAQKED